MLWFRGQCLFPFLIFLIYWQDSFMYMTSATFLMCWSFYLPPIVTFSLLQSPLLQKGISPISCLLCHLSPRIYLFPFALFLQTFVVIFSHIFLFLLSFHPSAFISASSFCSCSSLSEATFCSEPSPGMLLECCIKNWHLNQKSPLCALFKLSHNLRV